MSRGIILRLKEIIKEKNLQPIKILNLNLTNWQNLISRESFDNSNCEFIESNFDKDKENFKNHLQSLESRKFDIIFLQYPLGIRKGNIEDVLLTYKLIKHNLNDDGYLLDVSTQPTFNGKHLFYGSQIYRRYRENIIGEIYKPETNIRLSLYEYRKKGFLEKNKFNGEIYCCDLRSLKDSQKNLDDIKNRPKTISKHKCIQKIIYEE